MPSLGLTEDFVYIHVQISVRYGSNVQGLPGAVWFHTVGDLCDLWQTYTGESGQAYCLVSHGACAAVVMPGHVVYGLEGHSLGLRRSYEEGTGYSACSEGGEFGPLVPILDSN